MKRFLFAVFIFMVGFAFAQHQSITECLDEGKRSFAKSNLDKSQQTFLDCYSMDPENVDVLISLASIYLAQNNLSAAKNFFEKALTLLPSTSPYHAYCHSRLGDIYFKQGDFKTAKQHYEKSLKYNYANVNSIIGRGVILEYEGFPAEAARAYRTALAVEPYNPIARENYRRLEPLIITENEMLDALKERNAVPQDAQAVTLENKDLYLKIHRAEQSMGIEYLKDKYKGKVPKGLIVEKNTGTPELRFMLTEKGYNEVMRIMSRDAVNFFARAKVPPSQIYQLRDLRGLLVFDDKGILTEEGIGVYSKALEGERAFLLPTEKMPASKKDLDALDALVKKGLVEISSKEYSYIKEKTDCSDETLKTKLAVTTLPFNKTLRYFVMPPSQTGDLDTDVRAFPYYYAVNHRKDSFYGENKKQPVHSSFFGTGGNKDIKLCNKSGILVYGP
ncbi:Flp pilus assembly protein TadD, contains TPR repeats [Elusimicrobium minutum Pei191]|uniref:Flp pilus assembly protein TadD, contains TPR repeats n=1 Tax=Elusimicrobium minutum (strain Pei191) TaxID=445932 RepID=B2KAP7_ELUMP|nr:tetratricopeptide repeat protein [Elusimicrobium minutum]ACC97593.1 Flp pilus assembly protein TadD, contains TPR repeats [Elusimicrobium minutum Pei191]